MNHIVVPRKQSALLLGLACAVLLLGGCGGPSRLPVEGTVTLDGAAMERGQISFVPVRGTPGPTAGAPVVNGRFSIDAAGGPLAGTFRVEITAAQVTGRKQSILDITTGQMKLVDATRQIVPARYNTNSELTAELTTAGPNELEFAVLSK